jgi:HAMP domain-containing protein
MGIRSKFIIIITVLSLLATIAIGYTSYMLSRQSAIAEAKSKGEIIYNYIKASGKFFGKYQYPLIMEDNMDKDRFIPELMSKFVVSRMEFEIFQETLEGYLFKQATLDPLWPDNKADEDEKKVIAYFETNSESMEKQGVMEKNGENYFYTARPIRIEKAFCLTCHGDPADAPGDQRDIYGTENGYNWSMGETVGTSIVYISISKAMDDAKQSALKIFTVGIVCLLVTIICIWVFLDRSVVAPIIRLSSSAKDISIGKNLCDSIHTESNDEIGGLANSIDRMRISVNKLLKRTCPETKARKKK